MYVGQRRHKYLVRLDARVWELTIINAEDILILAAWNMDDQVDNTLKIVRHYLTHLGASSRNEPISPCLILNLYEHPQTPQR